jgi:hypothetical protein
VRPEKRKEKKRKEKKRKEKKRRKKKNLETGWERSSRHLGGGRAGTLTYVPDHRGP